MNKLIILKYINKLSKDDIYLFGKKQGVILTRDEINVIYKYIKERYNEFLNGNQIQIFEEIKEKIKPKTYSVIIDLFYKYKNYI